MRNQATSIAAKLHRAQHILASTRATPEIMEITAKRGYPEPVLDVGQHYYETTLQVADAQAVAAGAQRLATQRVQRAERQAREVYQELVQTVRALFPPTAAERKSLEVNDQMPQDTAAFIGAAMTLFNNALNLPDIRATLEGFGYDEAALLGGRETIMAYQQALQAQVSAKSNATRATAAQKAALATLQTWLAQYVKIARVTLRKRPELLRVLDIGPRRKPTPAPSAAPAASAPPPAP
jgi:hypothetical protein